MLPVERSGKNGNTAMKRIVIDHLVHVLTIVRRSRRGVTSIEYALLTSLIGVAILFTVNLVGVNLSAALGRVASGLDASQAASTPSSPGNTDSGGQGAGGNGQPQPG